MDEPPRLTIEQIRELAAANSAINEVGNVDPEFVAMIDSVADYPIFVSGNSSSIWSRAELLAQYPFEMLGVQPEDVFVAQELGVFPQRSSAFADAGLEYLARDVGDESVSFVMLEDMVGAACRGAAHVARRAPLRTYVTKIYVGREAWEDFQLIARLHRAAARMPTFAQSLAIRGGAPMAAIAASTHEDMLAAREAEMAAREAEVAAREEALAAREAEIEMKVRADLARLQAAMGGTS